MQLIERIRDDRDGAAFEALYDRHSALAMSRALRVVFDQGLAADAVQGAFFDVWRLSGSYAPERAPVSAWIAGITTNRAIDILRRARTQERAEHAVTVAGHTAPHPVAPVEVVIDADRSGRWRDRVDDLPATQREVIEMAYYDDLSHTEIATRLDLPLGTVKGRVRLGLGRLRHQVGIAPSDFT